ncbi:MAG: DUF2304 domain-containing protein [Oscillospiraceae bacterium]|nr:DUF2304 domain-containing protein [Oscillospiraceae bacterium]
MNLTLRIFFIAAVILFLAVILRYLSKNRLNLKYSLVWLATSAGLLILAVFPGLVDKIGAAVGIISPVNTVFVFALMFIVVIVFTLTMIVSHTTSRIYRLTQTIAVLEKRIRELEEKSEQ